LLQGRQVLPHHQEAIEISAPLLLIALARLVGYTFVQYFVLLLTL